MTHLFTHDGLLCGQSISQLPDDDDAMSTVQFKFLRFPGIVLVDTVFCENCWWLFKQEQNT